MFYDRIGDLIDLLVDYDIYSRTAHPRRIQHSRAIEYAPLSWNLAFLPNTTCSRGAES
jgi:hypothetical protein